MKNKHIDITDLQLIESKLYCFYSEFKDKSMFITGGTGFFGKWFLEAINHLNKSTDLNLSVTVLTRDPDSFRKKFPHLYDAVGVSFIKGDVHALYLITGKFDYIIHAAGDISNRNNITNDKVCIVPTSIEEIIIFSKKVKCKRLLYTSSGAVYENHIDEHTKGLPENTEFTSKDRYLSDYAREKRDSESYLAKELACELVIARCFTFCGPYLPMNEGFAFGDFIDDKIQRRDITIRSNGRSVRSYMYGSDLVVWLFSLLAKGRDRSIYNVGSDIPISMKELAKTISKSSIDVFIKKPKEKGCKSYYPNINKAKEELGLKLYTNLDDAIEKTIKFMKN